MIFRGSLRAQTAAVIVLGLLLSNLVGYLIYSEDRHQSLLLTEALDVAERAAGVSRLLRDLPAAWGPEIVQAADSRIFRVWTSAEPSLQATVFSEEEADIVNYLRSQIPRISSNEIRLDFTWEALPDGVLPERDPPDSTTAPIPGSGDAVPNSERALKISIDHGDGIWLNFHGQVTTPRPYLSTFLSLNLLSAAFGIGLLAFWLVHRVTAPLHQMAQAADRFGENIHAAAIPVSGPREVRIAAQAFNRMQRRLVRLIESRTEMLAAISHDLRTPITQMRLRTELQKPSPERRKTLAALDEMSQIIGTFLDFARATNDGELRRVLDVGSLVESICDDFVDAGADIVCQVEANARVSCKQLALKRAITNVIDNALRYGTSARVHVGTAGGRVRIQVDDKGPGIPEAEQEAVFAPFHRLETSRTSTKEGVGLGLSISRAIMEDHGGTISVVNLPAGGLRAEIALPILPTANAHHQKRGN